MAITGSDATVFTTVRDSLNASRIDENITGNGEIKFSEGALVGVTPDMASNIANGINEYKENVESILNKLEAVDSQGAFKGTQITAALTNFIESVKNVSINYLTVLQNAENQIISSVAAAYQQQDADVSSQMKTDASSVDGSKVNISN